MSSYYQNYYTKIKEGIRKIFFSFVIYKMKKYGIYI